MHNAGHILNHGCKSMGFIHKERHHHLLLHLLDLSDGAAPLGSLFMPQQVDVQVSRLAELLLLLFLSILQLALSADAFCVIHVIRLHHLQGAEKKEQGNKCHLRPDLFLKLKACWKKCVHEMCLGLSGIIIVVN